MNFKNLIGKHKGQMTVIGIIMILVALFVLNAFAPIFVQQIAQLKNTTANESQSGNINILADLILPLLVISIIISILIFAIPQQQG